MQFFHGRTSPKLPTACAIPEQTPRSYDALWVAASLHPSNTCFPVTPSPQLTDDASTVRPIASANLICPSISATRADLCRRNSLRRGSFPQKLDPSPQVNSSQGGNQF